MNGYKAAYHKNNGVTGHYYDYPTSSNYEPLWAIEANYYDDYFEDYAIGPPYYRNEVGWYDDSPYGTFDQGGNVNEWTEAVPSSLTRGLRGGSFEWYVDELEAAHRLNSQYPSDDSFFIGFRVAAAVLEPPTVTSAISYKTHGTAGDFGIDVLDRTADQDIEPRFGGVTELVVGFDVNIQGVGGLDASDVTLSSGSVDAVTLTASNELTIDMSGTTNGVPLTVSLAGIANVGLVCADSVCIRQFLGDVRPDLSINSIDRVDVRDAMGQLVDASNFRADVRADGSFNSIDRVDVRDAMGTPFVGTCP